MSRCSTASEPAVTVSAAKGLHPREWPLASGQAAQISSGPHFSEQAVSYTPVPVDSRHGVRVLSVQIAWKTWGEAEGVALAGIVWEAGEEQTKAGGSMLLGWCDFWC